MSGRELIGKEGIVVTLVQDSTWYLDDDHEISAPCTLLKFSCDMHQNTVQKFNYSLMYLIYPGSWPAWRRVWISKDEFGQGFVDLIIYTVDLTMVLIACKIMDIDFEKKIIDSMDMYPIVKMNVLTKITKNAYTPELEKLRGLDCENNVDPILLTMKKSKSTPLDQHEMRINRPIVQHRQLSLFQE